MESFAVFFLHTLLIYAFEYWILINFTIFKYQCYNSFEVTIKNMIPSFLIEKLKNQYGEELTNKILEGYNQKRNTAVVLKEKTTVFWKQ